MNLVVDIEAIKRSMPKNEDEINLGASPRSPEKLIRRGNRRNNQKKSSHLEIIETVSPETKVGERPRPTKSN